MPVFRRVILRIRLVLSAVLGAAALLSPVVAIAHEVPDQVTVRTWLKPEGDTLSFLVRAPMNSLRDVDIPTQENGFLDLTQIEGALRDAAQIWIRDFVTIYENGTPLPRPEFIAARVSLPGDTTAFDTYDAALAHITEGQPPPETQVYWEQGILDIAYEYPIQSENSGFAIDPGLTRLGLEVNITLNFLMPSGEVRVYDVHPSVGVVELDPTAGQAAYFFARSGFLHVLASLETLLFLLALALPLRRIRHLAFAGASLGLGFTVTLIASAYGMAPIALWFPYFIAAFVAIAILCLALEDIIGARAERRVGVAFGLGLVLGFAFAAVLGERLQFSGSQFLVSVLAFDVGLLAGTAVVIAIVAAAAALLFRFVAPERIGTIIVSAFVAHTAWDWTLERGAMLGRFQLPTLDGIIRSGLLWWAIAALALGTILWLASSLASGEQPPGKPAAPPSEN